MPGQEGFVPSSAHVLHIEREIRGGIKAIGSPGVQQQRLNG